MCIRDRSEGVEEARLDGNKCAKVVCCVNHDKNAILSHDANIPDALHFIEDIRTLELSPISTIVERIRQLYPDAMIMLHASLECTNSVSYTHLDVYKRQR